jgi:small subunit ribosomal protein S16
MPVKIRLMRIGAKKRPFYRVVAVDERKKRTGGYLELLGTYNPLTEPKEIIIKKDRFDYWVEKGAVLSDGYLRITKQAPQKPPRKPKKEKGSSQNGTNGVKIENESNSKEEAVPVAEVTSAGESQVNETQQDAAEEQVTSPEEA